MDNLVSCVTLIIKQHISLDCDVGGNVFLQKKLLMDLSNKTKTKSGSELLHNGPHFLKINLVARDFTMVDVTGSLITQIGWQCHAFICLHEERPSALLIICPSRLKIVYK